MAVTYTFAPCWANPRAMAPATSPEALNMLILIGFTLKNNQLFFQNKYLALPS